MINIIPLSKEHLDEIYKIETESFSDPWSKNMFLELIDNPLAVCFVATDNTKVAGYIIAYHIYDEIQILNIAVKESQRHKKIATELFDVIFEYAKKEKINDFYLEVRPSNVGAIALYKKLGFKVDGVRKNYYTNPKEDAILMSLRLQENI